MSQEIKTIIDKYIKLDDEIKRIGKMRMPLVQEKKILQEQITDYLETNGGNVKALQAGENIFKVVRNTRKTIKQDNIAVVLDGKLNDQHSVEDVLELMSETKETVSLKRSKV